MTGVVGAVVVVSRRHEAIVLLAVALAAGRSGAAADELSGVVTGGCPNHCTRVVGAPIACQDKWVSFVRGRHVDPSTTATAVGTAATVPAVVAAERQLPPPLLIDPSAAAEDANVNKRARFLLADELMEELGSCGACAGARIVVGVGAAVTVIVVVSPECMHTAISFLFAIVGGGSRRITTCWPMQPIHWMLRITTIFYWSVS